MDKSPESRAHKWISTSKEIDENDLRFVEKDLAFYEKVSLAFLLYGSDKAEAHYALQNLIILSKTPTKEQCKSELLYNYTKCNKNWRPVLIEALTIIQENKILRKLGFNVKELRATFLPHIPQATLFIHPLLKALYLMCEGITEIQAGKIILEMKNTNESNDSYLRFYETRYLEVFLLDWITKSIICIGKWSPDDDHNDDVTLNNDDRNSIVNLLPLFQCLKLFELDKFKEMLQNTVEHMNKKIIEIPPSSSSSTVEEVNCRKEMLNRNENDSALTIADNNFDRKDSYGMKHDECYEIRKEWAGFILIINQSKFYRDDNPEVQELLPDESLPLRRGTEMDCIRLTDTFSSFGYKPLIRCDLTNIEILNEIHDIVKRSEPYDSVIVCILSHGIEGAVYGSNSVPVEIKKLRNILASERLLGKPKLLIIQACQGEDLQKAKSIKKYEYDAPEPSVPAFSDMLTAISTVPGFASVRHIEKGTWFIQTLCKIVDTQADRKHMLDILTSVINEVSRKRGSENQCMVPETKTTLSKYFFLPKRFN